MGNNIIKQQKLKMSACPWLHNWRSVFFLKWKHDETYSFFTLNYLSRYSDINDQSQSNISLITPLPLHTIFIRSKGNIHTHYQLLSTEKIIYVSWMEVNQLHIFKLCYNIIRPGTFKMYNQNIVILIKCSINL